MPHYEELYPSRFLKSVTLLQPKTVRIIEIFNEDLEGDKGQECKAILKYKDKDGEGQMVCCKTNSALIGAIYGDLTENWPGKLITIHRDESVPFGSKKVGGIRVYGAPTLTQPMRVEIERPRRKKKEVYILQPTGRRAGATQATAPSQAQAQTPKPEDVAHWMAQLDACKDGDALDAALADARKALGCDVPEIIEHHRNLSELAS